MAATQGFALITAGSALATLPVFAYYFGITVPMVYDVQMQMAHRSFFDAIFCVTPTSAEMLAPSLAGFAAAAGIIGGISLVCLAVGIGKGNSGTGIALKSIAVMGIFVSGCFACTAVALAMYESMVLDQTISGVVHNLGITMGVLVGITAVVASATCISSFVEH